MKNNKAASLFPRELVIESLKQSFVKLNPKTMFRNPIMFIVEVVTFVMLFVTIWSAATGDHAQGSFGYNMLVFIVLFVTLLFANFAEAIAEARGKAQADSLRKTREETPAKLIGANGCITTVSSSQLKKGDVFICEAGDTIPSDGEIIEGLASIDESAITGESAPVIREAGGDKSSVTGGTKVLSDQIRVKVTTQPGESFLDKMIALVEGASRQKTPNEIALTILLAGFTLVFVVVCGTLKPMADYSNTQITIAAFISLFVCLIPTTIGGLLSAIGIAGMDRALRANVITKSGKAVETAGDIDTLLLDKTGTITSGKPQVTDMVPVEGISEEELLSIAYALEKKSEHPLAHAILQKVEEAQIHDNLEIKNFLAVAGNGLSGKIDKETVYGGNQRFIEKYAKIPLSMIKKSEELANQGKTPLFFACDEQLIGIIAVADVIKEDSPQAVKELQNMGIRVVMLTGDNERTAKAIGKQAGVDHVIAGVLPEGKESVIRDLKEKGKVAMVGDGINDAPALTRADMGIAIGAGTDIAIDAADVVLMKSRLSDVPAAIRLSRATLKNIHENLFWAFIYNIIGIPLAAGAWYMLLGWKLNPMFGAAAMSLSSFCVVTNALRLNLFKMHDASKDQKIKNSVVLEEIQVQNIPKQEDKTMKKTMKIEGMMCGHCEAAVKKALESLDGVEEATVSHEEGTAVVSMTNEVSDDVLTQTVEDKDYKVTEIE